MDVVDVVDANSCVYVLSRCRFTFMSMPFHLYVDAASPLCQCRITFMSIDSQSRRHTPHHLYINAASPLCRCRITVMSMPHHLYVDAASLLCWCRITFMSMLHHLYVNAASPLCQCRITFMLTPHHCHVYILHQPALTLLSTWAQSLLIIRTSVGTVLESKHRWKKSSEAMKSVCEICW